MGTGQDGCVRTGRAACGRLAARKKSSGEIRKAGRRRRAAVERVLSGWTNGCEKGCGSGHAGVAGASRARASDGASLRRASRVPETSAQCAARESVRTRRHRRPAARRRAPAPRPQCGQRARARARGQDACVYRPRLWRPRACALGRNGGWLERLAAAAAAAAARARPACAARARRLRWPARRRPPRGSSRSRAPFRRRRRRARRARRSYPPRPPPPPSRTRRRGC